MNKIPNLPTRKIGRTNLSVPIIGLGTVPIADHRVVITDEEARATIEASWDAGVRLFDTSPFYGMGQAEHRLGQVLRTKPRDEFKLFTKIGRILRPPRNPANVEPSIWAGGLPYEFDFDYTYDGIYRSLEHSLQRLGLTRIDALTIHDLDVRFHGSRMRLNARFAELANSGWRALEELKAAGIIGAVGGGVVLRESIKPLLDSGDLDYILMAMPYTLLDQDIMDDELPLMEARGITMVVGSVFASGVLATGAVKGAQYDYDTCGGEVFERVSRIEEVCREYNIALPAAALQFPLAHPAVSTIIPGALTPDEATKSVELLLSDIPHSFWSDLKSADLLRTDALVPE